MPQICFSKGPWYHGNMTRKCLQNKVIGYRVFGLRRWGNDGETVYYFNLIYSNHTGVKKNSSLKAALSVLSILSYGQELSSTTRYK